MISSFKEKIKNQTSKRTKQIFSLLPYLRDLATIDRTLEK